MASTSLISVIIPFKNNSKLTLVAIRTLLKYNRLGRFEIILIDNKSSKKERLHIKNAVEEFKSAASFRLLSWKRSFNWQKVNNFAAKKSTGATLCFLNNDIVFTSKSEGILKQMSDHSRREKIGVVGCLMFYPNGRIQHAGGEAEEGGWFRHLTKKTTESRKNGYTKFITGACHVISREKFFKLKGYDDRFTLMGGDIDLCARSLLHGWKNYYVANRSLIHDEAGTRRRARFLPKDFSLLYYSLIQIFKARDLLSVAAIRKKNFRYEIERYYRLSLNEIKEMNNLFKDSKQRIEVIPALPYQRNPRALVLLSDFSGTYNELLALLRTSVGKREVLICTLEAADQSFKGKSLEFHKLGKQSKVLFLDSMQEDLIIAEKSLIPMLKENFSYHKIIQLPTSLKYV